MDFLIAVGQKWKKRGVQGEPTVENAVREELVILDTVRAPDGSSPVVLVRVLKDPTKVLPVIQLIGEYQPPENAFVVTESTGGPPVPGG